MADVRNKYGDTVFRIEGNNIIDLQSNILYRIEGNKLINLQSICKFTIVDDYLYDEYGNRLGEMRNLGDILPRT